MMPVRSFDGAVATIQGNARKTEVNVAATAKLALQGRLSEPDQADVVALAMGFTALESQCAALRSELAAARAGAVGREYAAGMQDARTVLAHLHQAAEVFLQVYDKGAAPYTTTDDVLRDKLADAERWLVSDARASGERHKLLNGGS